MDLNKFLKFLSLAGKLKTTIRFSSVGESIKFLRDTGASHSWRLSLLVILMADEFNLDTKKALEIAIVHDIAESITGDIDAILIHNGSVSKKDKERKEIIAIEKLTKILPRNHGNKIRKLWEEYKYGLNKEAKFVKALDKLETMIHVIESGCAALDDKEFLVKYADKTVKNFPELEDFLKKVKTEIKKEFKKGKIPWEKEFDV
jgi:putative hydrolase of HD superfamily